MVMSMIDHARCSAPPDASRFLIGRVTCFSTQDWNARRRAGRLFPISAGRHADQLGEASAEGAQRRAADGETYFGDGQVAATQQRHRALNAPCHQVGVGRFAVGQLELATEVPCRHVHAAGERLDVQRLRVVPVHPVAHAAQQLEVAQMRSLVGPAGHLSDGVTARGDVT